jgi:WD40 repeat protein
VTETLVRRAPAPGALPETPYVGLVPYTEEDAAFFFGRDAEKAVVTANLRAARLTLVYGPSGVGKTSLLQAGVVHDLREQVLRNAAASDGRAAFAIAVFRGWRDDPLPALMEQIRLSVVEAAGAPEPEPWRPGTPVVDSLRAWTERARRLLVVLDQFEDYFLYHPTEAGDDTFDEAFPEIVNDPSLRVHFLLSVREDAWAQLDRFEGRVPQLFANYVRVEHLDRDGGRDAIKGPLDEYNRRLPDGAGKYDVEEDLVTAVLDAAATRPESEGEGENGSLPAGDEIEAPFLQLVMDRLWRATDSGARTLTKETLDGLGGAQRIVETHIVDALGSLTPPEQAIAAEAFRYLVTRSRRRVVQSLSDLSEWLEKPEGELAPVLEKLASGDSGRILRPVPPPPGRESEGARYELFHDVLADPILEWRRRYEADRQREEEERRQRAEREAEEARQRVLRRRLVAIVAGLLCLVLAFAGFAAWALHERSIANDRAAVAQSQSLAAKSLRVQPLAPKHAVALAAQAERKSATPQAAEALRRTLLGWPQPTVLVPPGSTTFGVTFSPHGKLVATAGSDGAFVRSAATGRLVHTLIPQGVVYSAAFGPHGKEIVTAEADGAIRLWRVRGWKELPSRARILPRHGARAAVTADGRFLVAGGHPGWPNKVWRYRDGRIGRELTARDGLGGWIEPNGSARVVSAAAAASAARLVGHQGLWFASSPPGSTLVVPGLATKVYRTGTGRRLATLPYGDEAAVAPNGHTVAAEGFGTVLWDLQDDEPVATLSDDVTGGTFSRDGTLFAGASTDKPVAHVWDATTGELLAELPPRPPRVNETVTLPNPYPSGPFLPPPPSTGGAVFINPTKGPGPAFKLEPAARFSPDGGLVATWGRPRRGAQLWEPFATRRLTVLRRDSPTYGRQPLLPAVLGADGRLLATARGDGRIDVRRTRDGALVRTLVGGSERVSSIAFDPTGKLVAAGRFDRSTRVWRVADGSLQTLRGHTGRVGAVAFSPDGALVASASEDGTVRIWHTQGGDLVQVVKLGGPVAAVAFSPDGDSLLAAGGNGTTRIWSTGDWQPRASLSSPKGRALVVRAVFSPDGKYVATLDRSATARIWPVDGGLPIRTMHNVSSVSFSPDGSEVVTGGGDATARIFRTKDGLQLGLLRGHTDTVASARFAPDGAVVVTAGSDGTVRIWQAATEGSVAVVAPSGDSFVGDALVAADGRLVTVSDDGVRLYACEPCLPPASLLALAERRLASSG